MLPHMHYFLTLKIPHSNSQCSFFSLGVPCTAKKRADTLNTLNPHQTGFFLPAFPCPTGFQSSSPTFFFPGFRCHPPSPYPQLLITFLSTSYQNSTHTHSVKFQGQPYLFPYSLFQTTSSTSPGFFSCAQIKQLLGLRIKMLMRTQDRKTPWFQLRYQQPSLQEVSANTPAKISQSIPIFQFLPDWPKWMIPPCKNTSTPYKFKILTPNQDDLNHPQTRQLTLRSLKKHSLSHRVVPEKTNTVF